MKASCAGGEEGVGAALLLWLVGGEAAWTSSTLVVAAFACGTALSSKMLRPASLPAPELLLLEEELLKGRMAASARAAPLLPSIFAFLCPSCCMLGALNCLQIAFHAVTTYCPQLQLRDCTHSLNYILVTQKWKNAIPTALKSLRISPNHEQMSKMISNSFIQTLRFSDMDAGPSSHTHTHTHTHTRIHKYTHTYTHSNAHTHTKDRKSTRLNSSH